MATVARAYGSGIDAVYSGSWNWIDGKVKIALVTSAYSPNQDTDRYWDDVSVYEIANGNGYTTDGKATTGNAISYISGDVPGGTVNLLIPNAVAWTGLTATFRTAIIYYDNGAAYASPIIGYVLYDVDQAPSNQSFVISWASGIAVQISLSTI